MSWDGVGNFVRTDGTRTGSTVWQQAKAAGVLIVSSGHDTHDEDIATGLENCVTRDGQNAPSANLPMGGFRHTNAADGTNATDYATINQLAKSTPIWAGTSGGTATAQTLTLTPAISSYVDGLTLRFVAGFTNTGSVTFNVNGLGAINLLTLSGAASAEGTILKGKYYEIIYNSVPQSFTIIGSNDHGIIHRSSLLVSVTNTTAPQTLFTYSIPANTLVYSRRIRVSMEGTAYNPGSLFGSNMTYTLKTILNGVTYMTANFLVQGTASAGILPVIQILSGQATNIQKGVTNVAMGDTTGQVKFISAAYNNGVEDMTAAKNLSVTLEMNTAVVGSGFDIYGILVELL